MIILVSLDAQSKWFIECNNPGMFHNNFAKRTIFPNSLQDYVEETQQTALSKVATARQFNSLSFGMAAFSKVFFAYGLLGFVIVPLGLFLAFFFLIRFFVSNKLQNHLSVFVSYFAYLISLP